MNCEEVSSLVEEFHDGLLESSLQNQVEKHLTECSSCQTNLEQSQELSKLLRKSSLPPPSVALSQGLMEAFQLQHQKTVKSSAWWQKIFTGSISIPKPILAGALILATMAIIGANFIGRNSSISNNSLSDLSKPVEVSPTNSVPEKLEQTKIVEVPVVKYVEVPVIKKSVVERIIYLNNPRHQVKRKQIRQNNSNQINEDLNNSMAKNKFSNQMSLEGFQPLSQIKTKIIKEEELPYEK